MTKLLLVDVKTEEETDVEYAIEHQHIPGGQWHQVTDWSTEHPLNPGYKLASDERIIRRIVVNSKSFLGETMTDIQVAIAELEAQIAELKKQLQEDKTPEQLYGRLGYFSTVRDGDRIGVCVDNRPDSDGDVRMFYLDQSGETQYIYKRVDDVEWLTGKVLTSSEEIEELPVGTVVCFTNSPNKVAVKVFMDGYCWRDSLGYTISDEALTEGVEVIRYGTGIGN